MRESEKREREVTIWQREGWEESEGSWRKSIYWKKKIVGVVYGGL